MSRHHPLHHNGSTLRRAIRAQAGPQAYPYQRYKPLAYQAKYNAYSGPSNYGVWQDIIAPIFTAGGAFAGQALTASQMKKQAEAATEAQREIEMARIESEERSRMAEIAAGIDAKTGGRGMTITLGVGALLLLGGGTYYVFRKRKKSRAKK